MGCASSSLLNNEEEFAQQLGTSALSHHIVKLTSTTYGLLNIDPPSSPTNVSALTTPPTPPARFTLGSIFPTPLVEPKSLWSEPRPPLLRSSENTETINSWELMSGLDADSFRFAPANKENSNPNVAASRGFSKPVLKERNDAGPSVLDMFEKVCPPKGENKVVIYTTTLRGIRKTFEDCNVVRAALEGLGVLICERDVSMDSGFREELRGLMKGKEKEEMVLPRVFVKGRYVGGAEEVMRIVEEGWMGELLNGLPKKKAGDVCEGCGGVRFLPCFSCNGSCKMVMEEKEQEEEEEEVEEAEEEVEAATVGAGQKLGRGTTMVVRCPDCNENGLVLCPICS